MMNRRDKVKRIALLFDMNDCNGCHSCEVACKQEHGLGVGPRVVSVFEKSPLFIPQFCHHCEDAPCALSCPEDAIIKEADTGVVLHDPEKCNGCNAIPGKSGAEKQDSSPCVVGCPAHIDVQGYVGLAAKGQYQRALALIKKASPFPAICGRVCPHPCESICNRGEIDEPVANRAIERFIADLDLKSTKRYMPKIEDKKEEDVAVIGSGPAGLSCAYYLAQKGYQVTIFEKDSVPGGMLTAGIPAYRLPHEIVDAEIQLIQDMGVTIQTGIEIGNDTNIAQLRDQGFKAFFIAIGAQSCLQLGIAGEDLEGVYGGLDYLRKINRQERIHLGDNVAVVGGGNTAMDAARSARRSGAENVFILYRRGLDEMPANAEEIVECQEEGIQINTLTLPVRFVEEKGKVKAVECIKIKLGNPDESGRPRPTPIPGSEFTIDADAVIIALGQESDWSCLTPECACTLSDWGTMNVDPVTLQSDDRDIFAGGDAARGPRSVIEAIADGRQAAVSIDRFICGHDLYAGREGELKAITKFQKEDYDPSKRAKMTRLDPRERIKSYAEVQQGLFEEMVIQEAQRCLSCGCCCVQACPYGVMQFNHEVNMAVKCDLCVDRREDNEAPACSLVCPSHCIYWGDPALFPEGVTKDL